MKEKGNIITRLFAYFIIYSIAGYIIETIFGLVTKGVIESRKNFLYGPFCAIYGVGAIVMIVGLQKFKKNNYTLFFGGFFIGSLVEYMVSLIGEMIFHIKWWDYSNMPFNINGRICIWFSFFWGILAIYLITHIQPKVDKLLDKCSPKILTTVTVTLIVLEGYIYKYTQLYENPKVKYIVDTFFNDEVMIKAFPNIKVTDKDGNIILVSDILSDIQPYYFRVFTPNK